MKIAAETIHTHRDCFVSSSNIYKLSKTARAPLIVKAEVLHVRVRDVDVCIFEIKVMSTFLSETFSEKCFRGTDLTDGNRTCNLNSNLR